MTNLSIDIHTHILPEHIPNWKKKFGGLGITELKKLKQLEEENHRLKQIVADLSLDKQMLQDVLKKNA